MENTQLTKEEVLEKYGDIELAFSYYYKYSFTYKYENDDLVIIGSWGCSSDDVYRYEVTPDSKELVRNFEGNLHSLTITKNKEVIFSYSDY